MCLMRCLIVNEELNMEEYIQIGVTALRDPATGEPLPAVPLYIKATPEAKRGEETMIKDIAGIFADKMRQYIRQGGLKDETA